MQKQKDKFQVILRIRPSREQDRSLYTPEQLESCLKWRDNVVALSKRQCQDKYFQFNRVFSNQSQEEVFQSIQHILPELFQGYNATFLAYGQTGTGKTHTVFGTSKSIIQSSAKHPDSGMFYRIGARIFSQIQKRMHETQFSVRVSFIQFYLDSIKDLLNYDDKTGYAKLQMKQNAKDGVILKGVTEIPVKSLQELFKVVKSAVRARKTESTSINKTSSRSHAVIQITLLQRWNTNTSTGVETRYRKGILKIVDLAGSERVSKTESSGDRLEEAKRINKQITTLGKCINMLATSEKTIQSRNNLLSEKFNLTKTHVPFRDSKLTRFLSESLEGKSKIVLCVCISSFTVHLQQTHSSLLFANQAVTLKLDLKKNEESFRVSSSIGNNSSMKLDSSFETPYKRQGASLSPISKQNNKTPPVQSKIDRQQIENLKNDIELIEYQLSGKILQADFKNIEREQLQTSLKTYGNIIVDLQNQIQHYAIKLGQYKRKQKY